MAKWEIIGSDGNISAEQVLLAWLKRPGNYHRFVKANNNLKRSGRGENKLDAISEIPILLENAGFDGFSRIAIVHKVLNLVKLYQQAHALATCGASTSQVQQAFCFYYDLASHIEGDTTRHSDAAQESPVASSSSNFPEENDQRRSVSRNVEDHEDSCRNNSDPNPPGHVHPPPDNLSRLLELHCQHSDRIFDMMGRLMDQHQGLMDEILQRSRD